MRATSSGAVLLLGSGEPVGACLPGQRFDRRSVIALPSAVEPLAGFVQLGRVSVLLSLSFSMNKPIPFRGFRTRLRPKFAILSQYIVDYNILIFAIATETRNLARFLQAVFAPKTAVFLGSFFAALFSSF